MSYSCKSFSIGGICFLNWIMMKLEFIKWCIRIYINPILMQMLPLRKYITELKSVISILVIKVFFRFWRSVSCSVVSNSVTSWTVAHQSPLSKGFFRQEHWSGLSFPSPEDLPDPGIEPWFPALQADSLPSAPPRKL